MLIPRKFKLASISFFLLALTSIKLASAQESKPASAPLPAPKEELLGELSPQTEPPGLGGTKHFWNKEFWSTAEPEADYNFDATGLRFAARAKQGNKWVLIVDGKERGTFDGIEAVLVTSHGQIVYSAKREDRWVKMLDDKELGPTFEKLGGGSWFSGDAGLEHHAYPGKRGKKWLMVVNGKEGPEFFEVGLPHYSPSGQHLAYRAMSQKGESSGQFVIRWLIVTDGDKGPEFEEVSPPVFSSDGNHLAYRGRREHNREVLVLDGKQIGDFEYASHTDEGKQEFDREGQPIFSPNGKHWAYRARRKKGNEVVLFDGKESPQFEEADRPLFSPDSEHLAYRAKLDKKREVVFLDGKEGPAFDEVALPEFSPDSRRFAYFGRREKRWRVILDGQEGPDFEATKLYGPFFSEDSQHMAYFILKQHGLRVTWDVLEVRDGKLSPVQRMINQLAHLESAMFSPDTQRFAYVLWGSPALVPRGERRADRLVVADDQEHGTYHAMSADLTFTPDSRHLICAVRGGINKDKSAVVIDGHEGKLYDDVIGGAFRDAPNGRDSPQHAFIYIAREGRKFYRVTQPLP
jgi:rRNA maturation protein Nop10